MLTVPRAILEALHLGVGERVGLTVDHERLIVERPVRPFYTLDELLAQSETAANDDTDDRWTRDGAVGNELI